MTGFDAGRPFAPKMPRTAAAIECICPQTVNRLGRESDQPPGAEQLRGPGNRVRVGRSRIEAKDFGIHGGCARDASAKRR